MMWKIVLLGCFLGLAVAQFDMRSYMMMQMMQGQLGGGNSQGSQGSQGSNTGNSGAYEMDNALRCRNTDNLRFVPCANWKEVCDIISMQTYNMPNMLSCSALGIGCCIKDIATIMMIRNNA